MRAWNPSTLRMLDDHVLLRSAAFFRDALGALSITEAVSAEASRSTDVLRRSLRAMQRELRRRGLDYTAGTT